MKKHATFIALTLLSIGQNCLAEKPDMQSMTVTAERIANTDSTSSISSINNITDIHASHISEIMSQSPGTWISRGNGQEALISIRSPVLTGSGGCGPFLMAEDNIPLRAPGFCNVNELFDTNFEQAERIEVLRGPGTVFYGSNAMHGIINIISPDFSTASTTRITSEYENSHDYGRLLIDHRDTHWLLQTNTAEDYGYKDDSGYKQQKVRVKYKQQGEQWTLTHNLDIANLEQETAGFVTGKEAYKEDSRKQDNPNPEAYRDAQSLRFYSILDYKVSDDSQLVFTPYVRSNAMDFLMHFQPGTPEEKNGHDSIGLQSVYFRPLTKNTRLATGFDADYSSGFLQQIQNQPGPSLNFPMGKQYDFDTDILTTAIFLQTESILAEQWLLTLGTRFENARYDYTNNLTDGPACPPGATACRYTRPADDAVSFYNWSPKISLAYEFFNDHSVYTSLSQAFRAPETNELFRLEQGQAIARIDSEEMDSMEIGIKGSGIDRLDYHLAIYGMEKHNVIFKDSNRQNVDNQNTRHHGIEISITALLANSLILSAQTSYSKHQYDSNIHLLDGTTRQIKGNIIDTAPQHIHNVILSWLPTDKTRIDLENVYVGSYYLDPDNAFNYEGHTLSNLRIKHEFVQNWEVALGILNILDQDYADRADITPVTPASPIAQERYFIGEPRSFRVAVSKTF